VGSNNNNNKHNGILHTIDRFQVSLADQGIVTSKEEKTMAAGAQMWQSKMFTEDQIVTWENKTSAT
jgi:hypothetical protein